MITGKDILVLAKSLLEWSENEADFRAVISRSYYAGFHSVKEVLINLSECKRAEHRHLIDYLKSSTDEALTEKILLKISGLLDQEFARRVKADYKIDQMVKKQDAVVSIECVQEIMELIKSTDNPTIPKSKKHN